MVQDENEWAVKMDSGILFTAEDDDRIIHFFRKYDKYMDHQMVAAGFFRSSKDSVNTFIFERVKQELSSINKEGMRSFVSIMWTAGEYNIQDDEFWGIVEEQLIDNKLHRYLDVHQASNVIYSLGKVARGSDELIDTIENYIIKHRRALTEQDVERARSGFSSLGKGGDVLMEALGAPAPDLPRLDQ